MDFSDFGAWVAAAAGLSALGRAYVVTIALRGTKPKERPEILRALPGLIPAIRSEPVTSTDRSETQPTAGPGP